jgi:hypothetical protein
LSDTVFRTSATSFEQQTFALRSTASRTRCRSGTLRTAESYSRSESMRGCETIGGLGLPTRQFRMTTDAICDGTAKAVATAHCCSGRTPLGDAVRDWDRRAVPGTQGRLNR